MRKKGQMLVIVIILISVFLGIMFAVSSTMLKDRVNQRNLDNSMTAYYAAESGLEKALLQLKNSSLPLATGATGNISANIVTVSLTSSYTATYNQTTVDGSNVITIKSVGVAKGVKRALKTQISNTAIASGALTKPQYWIEVSPN